MTLVQPPPVADETETAEELLARYHQDRDPDVLAAVVEQHIGLARHFARRFSGGTEHDEDLQQVAYVGLLLAIERFDPDRGLEFVRFAAPTITGELKRHLRDKGWGAHVPRRVKELHLAVRRVVPDLTQQLGRSPRIAEIARLVGASDTDVLEAMEAGGSYRLGSLDAPRSTSDGDADGDPLAARLGQADVALDLVDHVTSVMPSLAGLPDRDRELLRLRYYEDLTQSDIAQRLGCSQVHVSRLLTRAIAKVRENAGLDVSV
jgi:RNA polymerase sigma-B factor